jgi:cytochrome oxidase Cu insertion factor (SCO1/SenC/PrrC family)
MNALLFTIVVLLAAHGLASAEETTAGPSHESDHSPQAMGDQSHDHESMEMESTIDAEIGVDEHLGDRIPLDVVFVDEQGRELPIGAAITKPTLLLPVYFSCPTTCSIMLANLAQAINDVPLELGKDYGVLAVSFDEEEGPELARGAKRNFTRILKEGLPREEWRFLTGGKENILFLTDGIGFKFKSSRRNDHSVSLRTAFSGLRHRHGAHRGCEGYSGPVDQEASHLLLRLRSGEQALHGEIFQTRGSGDLGLARRLVLLRRQKEVGPILGESDKG